MKTMIYIERYIKYCIAVAMTIITVGVEGKTIYVSSSEGIETNNGLSASAPVNTIATAFPDKFSHHLDPISSEDLGLANAYMAALKNPDVKVNLPYITSELDGIMNN